jgi:hypothetical protein
MPPEKQGEFAKAAHAFLLEAPAELSRRHVLRDVTDQTLFCCVADGDEPDGLSDFMGSDVFRAIRGAAETLGRVEEAHVLWAHPRWK